MHERERHRIILSAVQERPILTVQDIVELTDKEAAALGDDSRAHGVRPLGDECEGCGACSPSARKTR